MNSTDQTGGEWDRYVYVTKAHCPRCNSTDLQTTRTEHHGDGAVTRRTQCRQCFHKFFVVVEE